MITLDDALNRNYYFYQGSGDVRVDFLKQVFDTFIGYNFQTFMYNKAVSEMKKGLTKEAAYERAYHQGVETAIRACTSIPKYRKEIIEKFNNEPGLRGGITDTMINNMKYTDLKTLRTNLGLSKRGKKVTKTEIAPEKTVKQAKKVLSSKTTQETAKEVIVNSQMTLEDVFPNAFNPYYQEERVEPYHEIEEFYTIDEARQAYPGYSYEELASVGVHLLEEDAKEKIEMYNIIDQILTYDVEVEGNPLTFENLEECTLDELLEIYKTVRKLNNITKRHIK